MPAEESMPDLTSKVPSYAFAETLAEQEARSGEPRLA